ncbi:hypothetical protein [Sulfurimonas sp.]|uniref:hypothetical protein n=1 Tax=Sulfurimonas sp. TaxID=2022749 RepID=UPI0019FD3525|nr:hypothetical protein [Sulfurimonas sp.]MBE0515159.1 hypothetical protein [Sulfurimonas sp.]
MKKIIFAFFLSVSSLFSEDYINPSTCETLTPTGGTATAMIEYLPYIWSATEAHAIEFCPMMVGQDNLSGRVATDVALSWTGNWSNYGSALRCSLVVSISTTIITPPPTICPDGQSYNMETCSCPELISCPENTTKYEYTCYPTQTRVLNNPEVPGVNVYKYADGSTQACHASLGWCKSYDLNGGEIIPNLPVTLPDGTQQIFNTSGESITNRFLQIGGLAVAVAGGAVAVVGSGGLATPAVGAGIAATAIHLGLFSTGAGVYGDNVYTFNDAETDNVSSTSENAIKIHLDTFQIPANLQTTTAPDGSPVQKVVNPDGSTQTVTVTETAVISTTKKADGTTEEITVPKEVLTTPVTSNDFKETNNIVPFTYTQTVSNPTVIKSDGTAVTGATSTVTAVHNPSNSTSSTSATSSTGTTSTSTSLGTTSTATGTTISSDGTTQTTEFNTKPITDRLDQIITQNTLTNNTLLKTDQTLTKVDTNIEKLVEKATERNEKLTDIEKAIKDINATTDMTKTIEAIDAVKNAVSDLNSTIKEGAEGVITSIGDLNTTISSGNAGIAALLSDINASLNKEENLSETEGGSITPDDTPTEAEEFLKEMLSTSAHMSNFQEALDSGDGMFADFVDFGTNLKADYDNMKTTFESTKTKLQTGVIIAPPVSFDTCAETLTIGGTTHTLDLCAKISPYSSLIYSIVYLFGLVSVLMFGVLTFLKMGGE